MAVCVPSDTPVSFAPLRGREAGEIPALSRNCDPSSIRSSVGSQVAGSWYVQPARNRVRASRADRLAVIRLTPSTPFAGVFCYPVRSEVWSAGMERRNP